MRYGEYEFHCLLTRDTILPEYKGSTFRGAFGMALKRVTCALKHQECIQCILQEKCVYCVVFEASQTAGASGGLSPPHPFVIEPSLSAETHFTKGDHFDFRIILFGSANEYLPYFVYAIQEMGAIGVGRRMGGKRGGFKLIEVASAGEVIFEHQEQRLKTHGVTDLVLNTPVQSNNSEERIRIVLETPLRLKHDNKLHATLSFEVLIRACLRRIALLNNNFGTGEPALDYRGLVERAKRIQMASSTIRWFDWKRYSNRQEQSMLMGGMIGEATYQGRLAEFLPLIRYCEKVHLGKATTFGLGKIKAIAEV